MIRLFSVIFDDGAADMVDPLAPYPASDLGDLDHADLGALAALAPGDSLRLGGGAAPLVSIVRLS